MLIGHSPTSGLKGALNLLWKRHLTWEGELPDNLYRTDLRATLYQAVRQRCSHCMKAIWCWPDLDCMISLPMGLAFSG